jgi:hypothetical protein
MKPVKRQDWNNIDFSGQGLRNLSPRLFRYTFLVELYISSNKLAFLSPAIGQLRQLQLLNVSHNQLTEVPPEIGMCTYLKQLLLFDNHIRTLPHEIGSLHQLEILGIEGNPLNSDMKQEIMQRGTKSLVTLLREQVPGTFFIHLLYHRHGLPPLRTKTSLYCSTNMGLVLFSTTTPATPPTHHHPRRRTRVARENQGILVEHPMRQVCYPADIRIHANGGPAMGIPQGVCV